MFFFLNMYFNGSAYSFHFLLILTSVLTNPSNWRIVSSLMCHMRNSAYINIKPLLKYTDSNLELEMHILESQSVVCIPNMKVQMPLDMRRFSLFLFLKIIFTLKL